MPISANLRRRLEALEAQVAPPARIFVHFADDGSPHDEQLARFKAENHVAENDFLVVVTFDDAA